MTAEEIIQKFGGIRPMARKTDIPATTINWWKITGKIPDDRKGVILEAAKRHEIDLVFEQ